MLFCFLIALLLGQQDQTPRPTFKVDPVYFDLAANTGGDFYLWAPGEFASSRLQVPLHHEAVLLAYGTMDAKKTFDIPVESGVKELTVFAGVERKDLVVLVRPDQTIERDVLPDVPFRAAIRGTGSNGAAFQRIESHLSKHTE